MAVAQKDTDVEKSGQDIVESKSQLAGAIEDYAVDKKVEKRVLLKFDLIILPTLAFMYLFNSMDRSNLGNAKTDGLTTDLGFVGNQYNIILSIFYAPFVLTAPGMNLLTKKYGAKYVLPIAMWIFGSMAMVSAACKGFGGLVATRWFLGMAESGFYPGVLYYLTTFYTRKELARRVCIFYAASEIAGAFTGLIAFGIFRIRGHLQGWQSLFLIEGSLTVAMGVVGIIVLPKSGQKAYFLSEEEREVAYRRIAANSSTVVDADFNLRQAFRVFTTDRLWPWYMAIGLGLAVPLYSVSLFLPQLIERFGFAPVKTNLYTVAPYVVGSCFLIAVAFSSDYFEERCLHLTGCLLLTCIGFIILATVDVSKHIAVGYFSTFLLCAGAFVVSPLLATWYTNNFVDENQRALLIPVLVSSANAMGLVSSNIFREQDAPKYILACVVSCCFGGVAALLTLGLGFYMKLDNRKRDRAQGFVVKPGDVATSHLKDPVRTDPNWRWMGSWS